MVTGPRPERRGQVHHHADDRRTRPAHRRPGRSSTASDYRIRRRPDGRARGVLLEAKAKAHTGRFGPEPPARTWPAPTASRPRRVDEVDRHRGPAGRLASGPAASRSGMGQRLGVWRRRCWATRRPWCPDEPVNGLDPEGARWMRTARLKRPCRFDAPHRLRLLPPDERDGPDRNVVWWSSAGGRLIADTTVDEFVARASGTHATVRTRPGPRS